MELHFTKPFIKKYKKLDSQSQKIIKKALRTMENDYSHPSLRLRKMKGYRNPDIWEASANMDLRITFEIQKPDTIILRNCGHHDRTLNNP
ncbi:type II toxin-antitoxin system RelE/ParE family toxin [Salicibibacter cibarius]|uniref:Type II toxin-antitoxin system RelE/ParE family toxin n=1 Tax=Salicibibacter cibarius TaxID=2743000 RepID=A0A7T6Z6F5_9BACI|nr:type II toxin-antitoxin system RelE/ParE family toxin [Salicibibacter cibarius]QQK77246.1 type II toxin-antitoxin system RelE/ParE family toxin [Salicibibacter cibarius]